MRPSKTATNTDHRQERSAVSTRYMFASNRLLQHGGEAAVALSPNRQENKLFGRAGGFAELQVEGAGSWFRVVETRRRSVLDPALSRALSHADN